jgi:hypothetical protein
MSGKLWFTFTTAFSIIALNSGCDDVSSVGSIRSISTSQTLLRIRAYDGIVSDPSVTKAILDVAEVQFFNTDGTRFIVSQGPKELDLLSLAINKSYLVGDALIPAGSYQEIRIILGESSRVVLRSGETERLKVPSGQESGLKLKGEFSLRGGRISEILVEFKAREFLKKGSHGYMLPPVARISSVASLTIEQEARIREIAGDEAEEMFTLADIVFQGQAAEQTSFIGNYGSKKMFFTRAKLDVNDVVKGDPGIAVELELLGGKIADRVITVSHVTYYEPGEKFLVFLSSSPEGLGTIGINGGKVPTDY